MMEIFLDEVNKSVEGEFDMYFKYIEKIASGAFGTVIKAYYYDMEMEVAVKVIDKTKHKFKNINRLKFEINILKQLKHKNIVEFIGCIETNSKMYIITEYIQDGTLKDLIEKRQKTDKKFTEEETSIIMCNLLDAVDYLHSREIVHRDIKPENILFNNYQDFSSLKLVDFGLSSQFFEAMGDFEFCGTLLYMAPEQIEKKIYTKAIDIWSAGIVMYILLHNGVHPFHNKGETSTNFLEKLKTGKWNCTVKISKMAGLLLHKLIEPNTSKRYTADKILKHPWVTRNHYDPIPKTYLETMRIRTLRKKMISFFGSVLFLNNCKKKFDSEKAKQEKDLNISESAVLNVNFINPLLQQKLQINERRDSSVIVNNNSSNNVNNNFNNSNQNKNSNNNNNNKEKEKEKEKTVSNSVFDFKAYFAKVEKMNKVLEESFIREREKCLTVFEPEDRPHITDNNSMINSTQNLHFNQRDYNFLNLNPNTNNINNDQYKKSIIKSNLKIKILKKDHSLNNKITSHLSNNNLNNNNNNNNNVNSGNSKNGEKNLNKYDSASNSSFKLQESPTKNSNYNNRAKELSDRKPQKSKSILEPGHVSPDIRRKKFEFEVPEFKLDFKKIKVVGKLSPVKIPKANSRESIIAINKCESNSPIKRSSIFQKNLALNKTNSININGNILNGNNLNFFNNREQIQRELLNRDSVQAQTNIKAVILPNINPPYI